jgi:hypothetical protein
MAAKKGVKMAANTVISAGKMAATGALAVGKMAATGALAAGKTAANSALAAGKTAASGVEDSMKSKGQGQDQGQGGNTASNDRLSGGEIETLVEKMYPELKECLCNSMAKMFTDSSPKLTSVVITEVENTLKTNADIRAHIENRVTLIADSVLKEKNTKELIIKSLTTECKTNINTPNTSGSDEATRDVNTLSTPNPTIASMPIRTSGGKGLSGKGTVSLRPPKKLGTRKNMIVKNRMSISTRNTRRFIKYRRELDRRADLFHKIDKSGSERKPSKLVVSHNKTRTGKLPIMK